MIDVILTTLSVIATQVGTPHGLPLGQFDRSSYDVDEFLRFQRDRQGLPGSATSNLPSPSTATLEPNSTPSCCFAAPISSASSSRAPLSRASSKVE